MHFFCLLVSLTGMKQLFVHVNLDNKPAQELYGKTGFQVLPSKTLFLTIFSFFFLKIFQMNPILQNNNQIASNINILVGRSIFHSIVFGQYENGNLHFYGHYFSISFSKLFIAIAIWIWDAIDMVKCLRRLLQIIYLGCNSWIYSIPTHLIFKLQT